MRNLSKGFTLIELLVVIAIIGLLASIVLASLATARNKSKDAAIQSDLQTIRNQAELVRDDVTGCYKGDAGCRTGNSLNVTNPSATVCTSSSTALCSQAVIQRALAAALADSGPSGSVSLQTPPGSTSFAVAVQLVTKRNRAWCVDSSGVSREVAISTGTASDAIILNATAKTVKCK